MTGPIRRIVVAVGSAFKEDPVLAPALALGRELGARLHVVHVFDLPDVVSHTYSREGHDPENLRDRYEKELRGALEDQVAAHEGPPETECLVVRGSTADGVAEAVSRVGAELVVVGASREPHKLRNTLGTVAERVIAHSPCPVLVVKREAVIPLRRVLTTTDLSDDAGDVFDRALDAVDWLARGTPEVRCLYTVPELVSFVPVIKDRKEGEETERAQAKLVHFLQDRKQRSAPIAPRVRTGSPAGEIVAEAREWEADLVVFGSHGRTGTARLLLGSVAAAAIRDIGCNALVVPLHRDS